jgi:hypothetical protein
MLGSHLHGKIVVQIYGSIGDKRGGLNLNQIILQSEHFQKYCDCSVWGKARAVFLGFGFVSAQSQGCFEPAPSPKADDRHRSPNPKIPAPNSYSIFSNALGKIFLKEAGNVPMTQWRDMRPNIMNKCGAAKIGLIKALILALGTASMAQAGGAYLPLTGPPAMRVLAVKSPKLTPMMAVSAMKIETSTNLAAADTNCLDIKAFNTNTTETVVSSAGGNSGAGYGPTLPAIVMSPGNPLEVPNGASMFTLPSQDTMGITPQILATYFQPMVLDTNGAAIAVPVRVGFIPPFAQPDKSSHAEYIIK